MAGGAEGSRKVPTIPSWQQVSALSPSDAAQPSSNQTEAITQTDLDPIKQARLFLQEDELKSATRERKVAFLEKKGLQADDIQKVLAEAEPEANNPRDDADMQTVFDSTNAKPSDTTPSQSSTQLPISSPHDQPPANSANLATKRELAPVITYPEFLLKPQKPPPLVTIDRLVGAGYVLAGISALTWGASKYLVAPMRDSLTSARHDLQSSTLTSLSTLNTKLESTVSHIPYIPPLFHHKPAVDDTDAALSSTSSDSDPTELFHRDIATQTSPPLDRTSRRSSLSSSTHQDASNPTRSQSQRLSSLHASLSSLLSSTTTTFSTSALSTSIGDLQEVIDKIESNSQPLYSRTDWRSSSSTTTTTTTNTNAGSTSAWNSITGNATGKARNEKDSSYKREDQTEAAKFKAEIRALKGAFLSSRNFPTPRPIALGAAVPGGGGGGGAGYGTTGGGSSSSSR